MRLSNCCVRECLYFVMCFELKTISDIDDTDTDINDTDLVIILIVPTLISIPMTTGINDTNKYCQ